VGLVSVGVVGQAKLQDRTKMASVGPSDLGLEAASESEGMVGSIRRVGSVGFLANNNQGLMGRVMWPMVVELRTQGGDDH